MGIMQLVAYGAQDVYITSNPHITFFKVGYRRHTNFSVEAIELSLNGNPDFGRRSQVVLTRNGDLVTQIYLMVKLPKVTPSCEESKFAWVRRIGYALIDSVEVDIGGSRIDKQYGVWLNIWYELAHHAGDGERGFNHMIGDIPELTAYNSDEKPEYTLYIPLKFWFNKHVGLALPLIAMQYHEVRISFEFNRLEDLIISNCKFRAYDMKGLQMEDASLLVNYVYCDSAERQRFARFGHEYLIEQVQFTGIASADSTNVRIQLDFNHPSKEIIWALRNGNYISGKHFLCYTHHDNWDCVLEECAAKILLESIILLPASIMDVDQYGNPVIVAPGEEPPHDGDWEPFVPDDSGVTKNGKIYVVNESPDKCLWINTSSLKLRSRSSYVLTDKIYADVHVDSESGIKVSNVKSDLTVRDLSFPVEEMCDTRSDMKDDVIVNQHFNFGVLIDGTGNPVQSALLQLNGHDRFDRREGSYFNYVQPDEHHTNTPSDGINVYSFALYPEQHQPSGSANLSRIDNTQLNITFWDPTHRTCLPPLKYINEANQLFVYDLSLNVLRVLSGLSGLAFSS